MCVTLKAKWGKIEFDIVVPDGEGRQTWILNQVFEKSRIPQDKVRILPANVLLDSTVLKDGSRVTVIGTAADQQLVVPVSQVQFIEDMTSDEIAAALRLRISDPLPVGLENLGNTCYLNAVVQCLGALPKFRAGTLTGPLGSTLKSLFSTLGVSGEESITPSVFVSSIRARFPQFNQRDSHGHYAQQDAEEFLRALLSDTENGSSSLFSFQTVSEWKCLESAEEPSPKVSEELKSLTCHMGTQLEPVSHLHEGLALSMKEKVSKTSTHLGRLAEFEKHAGMATLPEYLIVQFARFQWKAKSDSAGTEATKTKIIRKINFQKTLDVYDLCTSDVKAELDRGRERRRVLLESGANLEDVQAQSQCDDRLATGVYELVAAVTHQGRTSDGGHYMAMTKRTKGIVVSEDVSPKAKKPKEEDYWVRYDDDTVSETTWTKLTEHGGMLGGLADSQMAYLLFYAKTTVPA